MPSFILIYQRDNLFFIESKNNIFEFLIQLFIKLNLLKYEICSTTVGKFWMA